MNFPPSSLIRSEILSYRLEAIAERVDEALVDLGLRATVGYANRLQFVEVESQPGRRLQLMFSPSGAWLVMRPDVAGRRVILSAWSLELDAEDVAEVLALSARADATGTDLPTPFRWGHHRSHEITDLADFLAAHGVPRGQFVLEPAVAVTDDVPPTLHNPEPRVVLYESHGEEVIEISYDAISGWTVDLALEQAGARGRMDLRQAALGDESARPEVPVDALSARDLAAYLAGHMGYRSLPAGTRPMGRYAPTPRSTSLDGLLDAASACAAWLRWCGFTDASQVQVGKSWAVRGAHMFAVIHRSNTSCGVGVLERAIARASIENVRPFVVAGTGFTRPARQLAERAGAALFYQREFGDLRAANEVASALFPDPGDLLPELCDGSTCRAIGCVYDETCPNEVGAEWSDSSLRRWRPISTTGIPTARGTPRM